jgi:Xaa-Pro aminopeptidase
MKTKKYDIELEIKSRVKKLCLALKAKNIEGMLVLDPTNIRYLSGFTGEFAVLLVLKNKTYLITHYRNIPRAEREAKIASIKPVFSENLLTPDDLIKTVAKQISAQKIATIALDSGITYQRLLSVRKLIRPVNVIELSDIEKCRMVKSDYEIHLLIQAQVAAEKIMNQFLSEIKPGVSEKFLHHYLLSLIYKNEKLDGPSFLPVIASGESAWGIHSYYTNRKIRKNDSIVIDMGVKYQGYCSDMTRTVFLGKPTSQMKKVYQIVSEAQLAAESKLRSGIYNHSADFASRKVIENAGYLKNFSHGLGHSIGLCVHEAPYLSYVKKRQILKENMMFTIEPGIYIQGKFGVRIEDTVLLTESGCKNITHFPKSLLII